MNPLADRILFHQCPLNCPNGQVGSGLDNPPLWRTIRWQGTHQDRDGFAHVPPEIGSRLVATEPVANGESVARETP